MSVTDHDTRAGEAAARRAAAALRIAFVSGMEIGAIDEGRDVHVLAGLQCLEAYHSAHDADAQSHYLPMARRLGLAVTGGSDFHGEGAVARSSL